MNENFENILNKEYTKEDLLVVVHDIHILLPLSSSESTGVLSCDFLLLAAFFAATCVALAELLGLALVDGPTATDVGFRKRTPRV